MDKITSKEAAKILSDLRNSLKLERGGIYDRMTQQQQHDEDALEMAIDVLLDGWNAAAHYNEGYYDALNSNCWVRTADRLPTIDDARYDGYVLVANKNRHYGVRYWSYLEDEIETCPYWMPLPKLPEVEG